MLYTPSPTRYDLFVEQLCEINRRADKARFDALRERLRAEMFYEKELAEIDYNRGRAIARLHADEDRDIMHALEFAE